MSNSSATVTTGNMQLTPMRVTFNGVDLGGTSGGVEVSPKITYADIEADQFGKTVLDKRVSGYQFIVKFNLNEVQLKSNWKTAFPSMKLVGSGPNSIYADMQIGDSLIGHAGSLILHPLDHADNDLSGDYKFFKAACISTPQIKYTPDKQVELAVEMVIFPDTTASPARWFVYGDPSIGLVAATAGTPSFTGTGDGTCTSVSTGSKTATETITISCVGVPAANKSNWYVSGSISGPLGEVQITSGTGGGTGVFTSDYINFTITDGTTDFVVGDQFQIATTAANYS